MSTFLSRAVVAKQTKQGNDFSNLDRTFHDIKALLTFKKKLGELTL